MAVIGTDECCKGYEANSAEKAEQRTELPRKWIDLFSLAKDKL